VNEFLRRCLLCAVSATLSMQATGAQRLCVNLGPHRAEIPRVTREAVALLRSCGHDPAHYELELSQDSRFSADVPSWTIEFHPRQPGMHYPLGIRMEQPCLLRWLDGARAHPRQLEVMRLVERMAAERGLRDWSDATVTESADSIGVELHFDGAHDRGAVWRFLLDRHDLSLLGAEPVTSDAR